MIHIAILASGSGTNAENIINYFKDNKKIKISYVLSNNENARVLERAKRLGINHFSFTKDDLLKNNTVYNFLIKEVDFIILAGFLLKIPTKIIKHFEHKIINIHPALLPKYGGKGMYGDKVHESVIKNKETESGITIHYVNENYDEGAIIFNKKVVIEKGETAMSLANKIHRLEYAYFPKIIERTIVKNE